MNTGILKKSFILLIAGTMITYPLFASAHGYEDKNREKNREQKSELKDDKYEKKCLKAYGHLIAFGWLKNNEDFDIDGDCYLPFGISKKFRGNATSTDTISPVISNINSTTTPSRAVITWSTDEKANSTIFWSTGNVDVNSSTTPRISNSDRVLKHKLTIKNLSPNTTYNAIIRSKDKSSNTVYSSQFSFTTKSPIITGDTTSPTIHSIVAVVSTSTANIGWQTNEPSTSKVYYSPNPNQSASSTNFVENTSLSTVHLLQLTNLSTSSKYYIVVESKDAANNVQRSNEFSITTSN